MAKRINFTKAAIHALRLPVKGKRDYYLDDGGSQSVRGLGLTVTAAGSKSFHVVAFINGCTRRVSFSKFPDSSIENARKKAKNLLSDIANGENPVQKRKSRKASELTLRQVFDGYIETRKSLKPGTIYDYEKTLKQTFSDWLDKPMIKITKEMVRKRHSKRGVQSPARANNAMRVLRALFNYAAEVYEDQSGESLFPSNPVAVLSKTNAWYKVARKKTYISKEDIPAWFETVSSFESEYSQVDASGVRDYLFFALFTGARREEVASLKWSEVDLGRQTFTLLDTKNGEDVTLPMSSFILEMMLKRRDATSGKYVFPSKRGEGHIKDVRKQVLRIREQSGVTFTIHDLRRTFLTIAESLDIGQYTLKRLVNHKTGENNDITAGYIVVNMDRLKSASQRVSDLILLQARTL
jgi:integrase